jgi:peptidoglycan/LPS O-acetylase OafA/YrhL
MVFLGLISYAVYLWHQAFIEKARAWTGADVTHLGGHFWPAATITVAATVAVASASWYLVERPLLRAVHRRTAPVPAPAEPAAPTPTAVGS